ncbi:protein kinase [Kribbella sp. NPDC004875]|uniref:serine/threonine-protein kinase n=1 Tax=Kribbella sp. NPDC004875 TaxID=3364107 RepID=UPI003679FC12
MLIAERYRLGASLGRGGMGEVFRATDEALGREVAVKLMLRSNDDASAAGRFQREARAAARLSDPHIVAVYDFGQYDDNFYLVMELVEGRSVAGELAADGPLSWERAVTIVEQAAAGLQAAHAQDVVHRDIKPSNLLVAADGTIKVADFGIAHLPGSETNELTATGQIMGSPHYLSPERARGLKAGPESDVYALGCVLYQLVTGRPPFMGDHPTAVLYQHVDTAPVPPSELRPELAGPFEGVLMRMLAKDPAERPTAAQLTALPVAAEWFPTAALPSSPPKTPSIGTPAVVPPAAPLPESAPNSRKPLMVAAIAVLVLAGAITAGVVLHNTGDNLPPTVDVGPTPSSSAGTPSTPPTTAPTRSGEVSEAARRTSTTPSSTPTTPSSTPSSPTPSTPTTTSETPSSTPSSSSTPTPTPTPTKTSSSSTPSSTPTSSSPKPSSTPKASDTPPPPDTPTP